MNQNSESPIYATYELLNEKLAEFKDGSANHIDHDHPRRGSRGSILSGKAVVEPGVAATTIPAAHLAKLNLSTTGEFVSYAYIIIFANLIKLDCADFEV